MRDSDVVLTNSAGVYAPAIAETVIAILFYFARGLDFAVHAQTERRWDKAPFDDPGSPVGELGGATLGIIGFGGIGREVARRAKALGMRVLALRRTGGVPLEEILPQSSYLLLALPDTPETRGLVGARELGLLPPGAVVVNVGRGSALDEAALARVLQTEKLRGAGLDVFAREPLPPESPLWTLPNVLVLPHVSGASPHFWRRQVDLVRENLGRYLAGRPLRNVVDKRAEY
jgi:phosphoglycerate dehydrogenase-like enzyme